MSNYSSSVFNASSVNSSWYKTFHMIPDGSSVLDVGCSAGTFGKLLVDEKGCIVDGIELDQDDFLLAKKKLRNVYKLDIEVDKFPDDIGRYDVVFMGDVVEHLARPVQAVAKFKDLLRPGGSVVFSIPNLTHMSVRLMLLSGRIEYGRTGLLDETHLHFFNQEEIYRVFEDAGYDITKIDTVKRDIPEQFLKKELRKLGLEALPKFKKLAQSTNAATYQFVGQAKPSVSRKAVSVLPQKSPIDLTEKHLKTMLRSKDSTIISLKSQVVEAEKLLRDVDNSWSLRVGKVVLLPIRLIGSLVKSIFS